MWQGRLVLHGCKILLISHQQNGGFPCPKGEKNRVCGSISLLTCGDNARQVYESVRVWWTFPRKGHELMWFWPLCFESDRRTFSIFGKDAEYKGRTTLRKRFPKLMLTRKNHHLHSKALFSFGYKHVVYCKHFLQIRGNMISQLEFNAPPPFPASSFSSRASDIISRWYISVHAVFRVCLTALLIVLINTCKELVLHSFRSLISPFICRGNS